MAITADAIATSLLDSFATGEKFEQPYRHWFITRCLPQPAADEITMLPFPAPALGGVSGKREVHNATRKYFDKANATAFPVCGAFNAAFHSKTVTNAIEEAFGTRLAGTYLRVEYAQDTNGFWLEPHTDLGVKVFTMLLYLSEDASHRSLGTDIYTKEKSPVGRSPFQPNGAMVFIPSDITYHGFEARPIAGIRKSVIINYVTDEWRAREQLSFPDQPIG